MALAFRLFGKFNWPPTAVVVGGTSSEKGVVELHYEKSSPEDPPEAPLHPFLRWCPGEIAEPGKPSTPTAHLFNLTPQAVADWFKANTGKDCAIWLDASGAPAGALANQTWVVFRGAFLFEQYGGGGLERQWPLVTQCQYEKNKTVYSALGICRHGRPLLYLNLNLPLPVRRTGLSGTDLNTRAFPLSQGTSCCTTTADWQATGLSDGPPYPAKRVRQILRGVLAEVMRGKKV